MAKAAEFTDKGRRCHACNGPGWMQRYKIWRLEIPVPDGKQFAEEVDFHDTCVGSWLMKNAECIVQFCPGVV